MTVSTTQSTVSFAGGQATMDFSFQVLTDHPEHVKAKTVLTSSGAETDLTYNSDYTVALEDDGIGGTVTMSPSVSTLYTVTVYRVTADTQASDYEDYNQFPSDTLEEDLDRRTLISQEREEQIDRSVKVPRSVAGSFETELPSPVASRYLKINSSNNAFELDSAVQTSTTSYSGTIDAGADASKEAVPSANDIYVATDTGITYTCYTAGTWTPNSTINLLTNTSLTIVNSTGSTIATMDEDGLLALTGNADIVGTLDLQGALELASVTGTSNQIITMSVGSIPIFGDLKIYNESDTEVYNATPVLNTWTEITASTIVVGRALCYVGITNTSGGAFTINLRKNGVTSTPNGVGTAAVDSPSTSTARLIVETDTDGKFQFQQVTTATTIAIDVIGFVKEGGV